MAENRSRNVFGSATCTRYTVIRCLPGLILGVFLYVFTCFFECLMGFVCCNRECAFEFGADSVEGVLDFACGVSYFGCFSSFGFGAAFRAEICVFRDLIAAVRTVNHV